MSAHILFNIINFIVIEKRQKYMNMILKSFEQTGIGRLRIIIIEDETWFLGTDIGACLGYANPRKAYFDYTEKSTAKPYFTRVVPIRNDLNCDQKTTLGRRL